MYQKEGITWTRISQSGNQCSSIAGGRAGPRREAHGVLCRPMQRLIRGLIDAPPSEMPQALPTIPLTGAGLVFLPLTWGKLGKQQPGVSLSSVR